MRCNDVSIADLMFVQDGIGCAFGIGRAQCNNAVSNETKAPWS